MNTPDNFPQYVVRYRDEWEEGGWVHQLCDTLQQVNAYIGRENFSFYEIKPTRQLRVVVSIEEAVEE